MIKNVSPLRYPGGKTRACKILEKLVIDNFAVNDIQTLISPFFGGGSFEFYMQNKYKVKIVSNDLYYPLYNFWNCVKYKKSEVCKQLREIKDKSGTKAINKEDFLFYRNSILKTDKNFEKDVKTDIKLAVEYFTVNRCSFSGSTMSGGFSEEASKKRFTQSSIDRVENMDLSDFEIHNEDFTVFLRGVKSEKYLIFLDPPYYLEKGSKLYGSNGDMHEKFNHELLYETIKDMKNWILTYNNCEYIRELYKDYTIIEVDWKYGMKKGKSSEIVIFKEKGI